MLIVSQLIRLISVKKHFQKQLTQQMKEKKISSTDKRSDGHSQKHKEGKPDKRYHKPNGPYEGTEPQIKKEMSIIGNPDHPHHEEILDSTPK